MQETARLDQEELAREIGKGRGRGRGEAGMRRGGRRDIDVDGRRPTRPPDMIACKISRMLISTLIACKIMRVYISTLRLLFEPSLLSVISFGPRSDTLVIIHDIVYLCFFCAQTNMLCCLVSPCWPRPDTLVLIHDVCLST